MVLSRFLSVLILPFLSLIAKSSATVSSVSKDLESGRIRYHFDSSVGDSCEFVLLLGVGRFHGAVDTMGRAV